MRRQHPEIDRRGHEQDFNSSTPGARRPEAKIARQRHEGWSLIPQCFDEGGNTDANVGRPALTKLQSAVEAREVDSVAVYKVDRLSRTLLDFAKLIGSFDRCGVCFVSVTQQFNTTSSFGRLEANLRGRSLRKSGPSSVGD